MSSQIDTFASKEEEYFVIKVSVCSECKGTGNGDDTIAIPDEMFMPYQFKNGCGNCNAKGKIETTVSLREALNDLIRGGRIS